jgi:antitoxin VapB
MRATAKVFRNGKSQAIRIPRQFRVATSEVYIRQDADRLIIEPKPAMTLEEFLAMPPLAPEDMLAPVPRTRTPDRDTVFDTWPNDSSGTGKVDEDFWSLP